jgi:hypothetical protein
MFAWHFSNSICCSHTKPSAALDVPNVLRNERNERIERGTGTKACPSAAGLGWTRKMNCLYRPAGIISVACNGSRVAIAPRSQLLFRPAARWFQSDWFARVNSFSMAAHFGMSTIKDATLPALSVEVVFQFNPAKQRAAMDEAIGDR